MKILPAIDIKGGKCVRLLKGDFNQLTEYKKSPIEQAQEFSKLGFKNIHIIDLDGALKGELINKKIIKEIIKKSNVNIQVGGGIRSLKSIEEWISVGVEKVIIGTFAVEHPNLLKEACKRYKNKIALALDVRNDRIALSGWKNQTEILASDFLKKIKDFGIARIIYTDIDRDGTMQGPNTLGAFKLFENINIPIIISGGISSISDILKIKKMKFKNIEGVIVGKAIYDSLIDIRELSKII
tara:strand:+ start:6768 stop:7487 length:720 start_codon:yes stop_codon:yes gene_type:complete